MAEIKDFQKFAKAAKEKTEIEVKRNDYRGCQHRQRVIDEVLRVVNCKSCGVQLDPIQVLLDVAKKFGDWKVVQLQKRVAELERIERTLAKKQEIELMSPDEREMSLSELQELHRKNGCPRERMYFKRNMIHCFCGWGFNRESYPALAAEVEAAHDKLKQRSKMRVV